MTDTKRNGEAVGGMREAIAAFLKDRDEAFIMSDEQTDEERLDSADEIMKLIGTTLSEPREPVPVEAVVKPLEWRDPGEGPIDPSEEDNDFCADGIGGAYAISKEQPVGPKRLLWWAHDPFSWAGFGTVEEAKAAAQADYEQRIRSALVEKDAGAPATVNRELRFAAEALLWFRNRGEERHANEAWDALRAALASQPEGRDQ